MKFSTYIIILLVVLIYLGLRLTIRRRLETEYLSANLAKQMVITHLPLKLEIYHLARISQLINSCGVSLLFCCWNTPRLKYQCDAYGLLLQHWGYGIEQAYYQQVLQRLENEFLPRGYHASQIRRSLNSYLRN